MLTFALTSLIRLASAQTTPLSGTYSIGLNGNYPTVTEAVASLISGGIAGPVIFNIKDGDYNEQIIIPEINGSSDVNSITFQSESSDSTAVRIYYESGYDNNYIIRINGADHITFRKITFETTSTDYGKAIVLDSGSNYNHFESNIFRVPDIITVCTWCNEENSLVYSGGGFNNDFNSFISNRFENSNYGINIAYSKGLLIYNNTFTDQLWSAIYVQYQDSVIIRNNIINSITDFYDYFPVYGVGCSNYISFENNKIFAPNAPNGIYFADSYGSESNYGIFANNFVNIGGPASEYTLVLFNLRYCGYINFIYNSLYLNSPYDGDSRALQLVYPDHVNVINNILDNSSDGYAYFVNGPDGVENSDYNDIYTSGSNLAYWSDYLGSLQDLQSVSGKDQNSVSINPHFISGSDLHVSDGGLNGKASPVPFINEDIDGDLRNPATPDIGADEFDPPSIDAGLADIIDPSTPFASGVLDVSVRLINSGLNPLTSVSINWSVNGINQSQYNWSGNLLSGETEDIILGNYTFERNQSYNIKCWSDMPNGIADPFPGNDTIQVSGLVPSLSGIYTIGGAGPDFATIADALNAIYTLHLVGDVVFKLRAGTYNEQLYLDAAIGTSPQATLTFESESGDSTDVDITWNSTYSFGNYTLYLHGADYVTFRNLTLSALNNTYGRVIDIRGGSDHNSFSNCIIKGVVDNGGSDNTITIYGSTASRDNYNSFTHNRIINGSYGLTLSSDYNVNEIGNIIEDNIFENQYRYGIQVYYQDSLVILNNTFSTNSNNSYYNAIDLQYSKVHLIVLKNRIYIPNGGTGIQFFYCMGTSVAPGLIANNFISIGGSGGSCGIYLSYSEYHRIFNNNIHIINTAGSSTSCLRVDGNTKGSIDIENNILANFGGGYCLNISPSAIGTSDYNDLYTTGQYLAVQSGYISSLSELQSVSGKDTHSISVDPKFISDTDLHVRDAALNNSGNPLPDVPDDIDGEPRDNLHPDIGADEFSPYAVDAGMYDFANLEMPFTSGNNTVSVIIKNYGGNTLENVAIDWMVNGVLQTRFNWSGSLGTGDTVRVDIGNYDFAIGTAYSISTWTSLPNGQTDQNNENDTIQISDLYAGLSGLYTIGGISPDFQNFTEAVSALNLGGITGEVTFKVRNGTYTEQISINKIPGGSKTATITFESESADSTSVILSFNANSTNNYTLQLDGSEYILFKHLTIRGTNTAGYGTAVNINNSSGHISFSDCVLGNTVNNAPIFTTTNSISNYLSVKNNRFENGSYGIYLSVSGMGNRIENNHFINQNNVGMYLINQDSLVVVNNAFSSVTTTTIPTALSLTKCRNTRVEKNHFILAKGGYGISLTQCYGPALIANNFIQIGGSAGSVGIYSNLSNKTNIYHNSINITNTSGNSCAFKISDYGNYSGSVYLKNNILVNSGGGYCLYTVYPNIITESDFNDLYTTGTWLAYWGDNRANLTELRLASSKDSSSISIDPQFVSDTDLHVQETALNNSGTPLNEVTDDIDGDYRDPDHPDIGADEFLNATHDMSVTGLLPNSGCQLTNSETITVTIKNVGGFDETGFEVAYVIGNNEPVVETITQTIPEGGSLNYSFSEKADLSAIKSYFFRAYTLLPGDYSRQNDTIETYVSNMPKLDLHLNNDTAICAGNYVRLSVSGADTYLWNNGSKTSYIYVTPAVNSTYTVYANNLFNCEAWDTVTVKVNSIPPVPVVTASGPLNFCNDSSVILTSSYDHNISWSNKEKTPSITVYNSGDYYVQYTDSVGCVSESQALKITREPSPMLTPLDTTICSSNNITIEVKNAAGYLWSNGAATQNITVQPSETTSYSVTATTPLGCEVNLSTTIHIFPSKTPGSVSGMTPADGTTGLSLPFGLSWMPTENTTYYDVYIWPDNQTMPDVPFASNVNAIRYELNDSALSYGTTYKWQVVSKYYGCETTPGPVQTMMIRHLPDLVVSNVLIPSTAFTGEEIEVTWDVTNQGLGNTGNSVWTDLVSLSLDTTKLDLFHILGRIENQTYLEPGQSYSKTSSFKLPELKDGLFSIFAWPDVYNKVLETDNDNNQGRADHNILVKLAPVPDLFVSNIVTPQNFFSEDTLYLTWKVVNKGNWRSGTGTWTDRVWFSSDYNTSKRYLLGDFKHVADSLNPGESYTTTQQVIIPEGVFGRFYFYVHTDVWNNVQEHALDGNNLTQSDSVSVILRPPADLVVSDIVIPQTTTNTGTISVRWKFSNIGNSSPHDYEWADVIYLSKLPVFKPEKAYAFYFSRKAPDGIPLDYEYTYNDNINIPKDIPADNYYVYVFTDRNDNVFEYTYNDNNLLRSDTTINISIAPWPDLIVTDLILPDSAGAGETIPVRYTVKNRGSAIAKGKWSDFIQISGTKPDTYLRELKRYDDLSIDSSYTVTTSITLPSGFDDGSKIYQMIVNTDKLKSVFEYSDEFNNYITKDIFIKPSDLSVTGMDIPQVIYSGTMVNIGYTVKNIADAATPAISWYDRIEILDSTNHSITPIGVNLITKYGPVLAGGSYSYTAKLLVPDGISGNYYIRYNSDMNNANRERITGNNIKVVPVKIQLRKPTDLIVDTLTVPAEGIAGQPVVIEMEIKNQGTGATYANTWSDFLYLSQDTLIDDDDVILGIFSRRSSLGAGDSYKHSEILYLPSKTLGNFYIIAQTDHSTIYNPHGQEFEFNAENNNTTSRLISIKLAPPSDLVVTNITAPGSAVTGEPLTISWTIKNLGPNATSGYLTDMVYLSSDMKWDIEDHLFGENPVKVNIDPGQVTTFSLTTDLTGTSVGDYHIIVRTDNKNNINEVTDLNNTLASTATIRVEVAQLPLNTQVDRTLYNERGIFYRIEIPDSLVDETLLVTLEGDSISGVNELFLSYEKVPDRSDYDFKSRIPFFGNQEAIVPSLKKGSYYLLVYGTNTDGTQQDIRLYASKINFQVRSITTNQGGNRGNVTSEIHGAKFTSSMKLLLMNETEVLPASNLIFMDETQAFVTFNLLNATLGSYDVVAINEKGDTAIFKNGYEVVENSPFGLVISVKSPEKIVYKTITTFPVQFTNDGNIDIPIPSFKLISENYVPIALSREDLHKLLLEVEFELRETGVPLDILRPGAINSLYIWIDTGDWLGPRHFRFE